MHIRTALALSLLVALAACQAEAPSSAPPDAGTTATPGDALPDTATVREVSPETTDALLARGLDAASPSVAIQTIDLWIDRIDAASVEGEDERAALGRVGGDLETLRNLLQSSPLDGPAIGRTLGALGDETAGLAAPGTPLAALARTLRAQGARLVPAPPTAEVDSSESSN